DGVLTRYFTLSSHLSIALIVVGIGTLLAHPEDRHLRVLFSKTTVGLLGRRLFFGAAMLPLVFSGMLAWLVHRNQIGLVDGMVLALIATITSGFGVALFSREAATGIDDSREEAEQARSALTARLHDQAANLQQTVDRRTQELLEDNANLKQSAETNQLLA